MVMVLQNSGQLLLDVKLSKDFELNISKLSKHYTIGVQTVLCQLEAYREKYFVYKQFNKKIRKLGNLVVDLFMSLVKCRILLLYEK